MSTIGSMLSRLKSHQGKLKLLALIRKFISLKKVLTLKEIESPKKNLNFQKLKPISENYKAKLERLKTELLPLKPASQKVKI